ncbi:MAG: hypothetical protein KUA37_01980 [Desulfomicrobium sp.]|nr:hypothetical protein [Pseudomonadota bacterium]MBV1710760.1 hypothetical protein [Desulfomicrobium sp.]MBU4570368.1 hypothetical protein [Pseudomonadota bacterium]MBU4593289.1 hypothetical protein [Pseudomonadota bacterium]MBV1721551.1 hypothetical protein [Desulfomicrobium sp.]
MTLTQLEILLATIFLSCISSLITWAVTSSRCQSRAACDERHKMLAQDAAKHEKDMQELRDKQSRDNGMILRMLRAVIMHLPIDNDTREEIINDRRSS